MTEIEIENMVALCVEAGRFLDRTVLLDNEHPTDRDLAASAAALIDECSDHLHALVLDPPFAALYNRLCYRTGASSAAERVIRLGLAIRTWSRARNMLATWNGLPIDKRNPLWTEEQEALVRAVADAEETLHNLVHDL